MFLRTALLCFCVAMVCSLMLLRVAAWDRWEDLIERNVLE